jgi:hypothetical protein
VVIIHFDVSLFLDVGSIPTMCIFLRFVRYLHFSHRRVSGGPRVCFSCTGPETKESSTIFLPSDDWRDDEDAGLPWDGYASTTAQRLSTTAQIGRRFPPMRYEPESTELTELELASFNATAGDRKKNFSYKQ